MSMSRREHFWNTLCEYGPYLRLMQAFLITLLVLTLLSMAISDQNTGAYVISLVNVVLLTGTLAPVSYCVWRCKQSSQ